MCKNKNIYIKFLIFLKKKKPCMGHFHVILFYVRKLSKQNLS